jgi:hypothetical protein
MHNEVAYLADDSEALRWSLGCVQAALVARVRALYLLDVPAVQAIIVLIAACGAFSASFPTLLTIAYRLQALGAAEGLGGLTAGDDYRRLIPLMEAVPAWLHVMMVAAGACYLAAMACVVRRRRAAAFLLVLAVGIERTADLLGRPIAEAVGVVAVPNPSVLAAVILPVVLPLLTALAAWSGSASRIRT